MNRVELPSLQTRWTLVKRLKDLDDSKSWTTFYDTYANLIYGFALKAGLTHIEAQEALQETIIEVSKRIPRFHAERKSGSFKSWLCKLASWKIGDQYKKRRRNQRLTSTDPFESEKDDLKLDTLTDPTTSTELERIWISEWENHLIHRTLAALDRQIPTDHYQIFLLLVRDEAQPATVAESFGYSVSRIYVIKHRVSKRFTKLYQSILAQES